MFFSRLLCVVYKTTGGRAWNPPGGLRPLTKSQKRNRHKSVEQTLKNISILKMAEANRPWVPVRLYKPLNHWRLLWLRRRLDATKRVLGWGPGNRPSARLDGVQARVKAMMAARAATQLPGSGSLVSPQLQGASGGTDGSRASNGNRAADAGAVYKYALRGSSGGRVRFPQPNDRATLASGTPANVRSFAVDAFIRPDVASNTVAKWRTACNCDG